MNKHDLEERLINFAVCIIEIVENMPDTKAAIIWPDNCYAQGLHLL